VKNIKTLGNIYGWDDREKSTEFHRSELCAFRPKNKLLEITDIFFVYLHGLFLQRPISYLVRKKIVQKISKSIILRVCSELYRFIFDIRKSSRVRVFVVEGICKLQGPKKAQKSICVCPKIISINMIAKKNSVDLTRVLFLKNGKSS